MNAQIKVTQERIEVLDECGIPYKFYEDKGYFVFHFDCPRNYDRAVWALTSALLLD